MKDCNDCKRKRLPEGGIFLTATRWICRTMLRIASESPTSPCQWSALRSMPTRRVCAVRSSRFW